MPLTLAANSDPAIRQATLVLLLVWWILELSMCFLAVPIVVSFLTIGWRGRRLADPAFSSPKSWNMWPVGNNFNVSLCDKGHDSCQGRKSEVVMWVVSGPARDGSVAHSRTSKYSGRRVDQGQDTATS